jgi:hypothetical protein
MIVSRLALVAVIAAFFSWEAPLHAYLDPGSGSMLVQLLLGGGVGIAVALRLVWRGLRDRLGLRGGNPPETHGQ